MRRLLLPAMVLVLVTASLVACSSAKSGTSAKAGAPPDTAPCSGPAGVGGPVPASLAPGDLVASTELNQPAYTKTAGYPTGARVWRILYVSSGLDETDLHLVCGLVVAPTGGPKVTGGTGRMFAWAHGTIGLGQQCQPSSNPASFWSPMPDGIGAIAWGTKGLLNRHEGRASDGLLQYAIDQGRVVTATDYQPPDTYIAGRIAAANVLDANRAGAQLTAKTWPSDAPARYQLVVAGHSQGGHSVMFTGQLAESYLAATRPSRPTAAFDLVGLAAEAPASNFVADPARQPGLSFGDGLADSEMHQTVKPLLLDLPALTVQIGPVLFSLIFGSWDQLSKRAPAPGAALPGAPPTGPLDLSGFATTEGIVTIGQMQSLCLDQAKQVKAATANYRDAASNAMLVPNIWNLPAKYSAGDYFKGGLDRVCATTSDANAVAWCDWVRWNTPGPLGVNPYPKAPTVGGQLVPVLIAQGQQDNIVNCLAPSGLAAGEPVGAAFCSSRTLYDALSNDAYCRPGTTPAGYLQMDQYRKITFESPAQHTTIPGQIAAKSQGKDANGLTFRGSRLQQFVDGAYARSLPSGCSIAVANAPK